MKENVMDIIERFQMHHALQEARELENSHKETKGVNKTESNTTTHAGWSGPFWFAVLSPVFGILAGFLALVFFYG